MPTKATKDNSLGRLKAFGLTELWQVALLLPEGWDDLSAPIKSFKTLVAGEPCLLHGRLSGTNNKFDGQPRLTGYISDTTGNRIGFTIFGDTRLFQADLKENADSLYLFGTIDKFNNGFRLKNPEVIEERWVGRYRPRYPGKAGVINSETVRERICRYIDKSIQPAADFLANELALFGNKAELTRLAGLPLWPMETIIRQAHLPKTVEYGQRAQQALERLAAFSIIKAAKGRNRTKESDQALLLSDWNCRAATISFQLTDEQKTSIQEAIADIKSDRLMHRILSGDVGTGKTAVYGTIAATVVDGLGTAVILLPNESLAAQVAREFREWWPDLPIQLVTGSTKAVRVEAPLVIGTTAVLFRDVVSPDLLIVDEQQKMSREQREQLIGPNTHLLEVSATCIPRTLALARYGVVEVSKLTKCHTPKTIHTRVWHPHEGRQLFDEAKNTLESGGQILLVYPLREKAEVCDEEDVEEKSDAETKKKTDLRSAEEIYEKWSKMFPGQVRWMHGQMTSSEKAGVLGDMRVGVANVLVSTTVVEVGITIPNLKRIIIVHPERHGLTTLHQLRGRVARLGGDGWCDLYLTKPAKESTMQRLRVMEMTQDGFQVAEHDMRLRGVGDLSKGSTRQSGADMTILYGKPVSIEALDAAMEALSLQTTPQ